ncbi:kyphoscoliosis peptidase isoform X2 [Xenopus laevis]|uniref:Transglutaminase-like domain-containing protein n=2 Tax=Xenopus laevis TaxID=8355 RepID=A0A974CUD8_XENLA|nr:kyphoscoliosis peptidase isoform X2 [Xenopus laevis]OCT78900.1 hypothetical protein XELAEV_18029989mg [Xenopus laevis]
MALHQQLSLWQKILLGILCFPLLPIYFCVSYLCLKRKKKNELEENNVDIGHVESGHFIRKTTEEDGTFCADGKNEEKCHTAFKYPWDKKNLKSLQVDLVALAKLDAYATKVNGHRTLELLVKDLLCDASTDLEKTRAIWIWICQHIENDAAETKNKGLVPPDPEATFQSKKTFCTGYSSLFQRMCSLADIRCNTVCGYRKGQTFSEGPNHAWNTVYLENSWHLLDCTMGAGYVDDSMNKFTFQYNEFYFLTHPALFIEDHFPERTHYQLLELPLFQNQFEGNVHRRSHFYTLGLGSSHPHTSSIETVRGKACVTIERSQQIQFIFSLNETEQPGLIRLTKHGTIFDVYPLKTGQHLLQIFAKRPDVDKAYRLVLDHVIDCKAVDNSVKIPTILSNPVGPSWISEKAGLIQPSHVDPIINTEDGRCTVGFVLERTIKLTSNLKSDEVKNMPNHVIQWRQKRKVEFQVHLPQPGTYVLQIFGGSSGYICNYLITCSNPSVKWKPFPAVLHNPVGPNPDTEKIGIHPSSHPEPVINTEDGCCNISFALNKVLHISSCLKYEDVKPLRNHIIQKSQKNNVTFNVRLPQAGSYVLQIFGGSTGYICNYLLICTNPNVKWPPFPAALHNPVGPNPETEKVGLCRPSHSEPIINTEDGSCIISFALDTVLKLTSSLISHDGQNILNHVLQKSQKDRIEFNICLPHSGSYVFQIFEDTIGYICNYLLTCTNYNFKWPPFPSALHNPVGPTPETETIGLLRPSHPNPIIESENGCCTINFELERDLCVFPTLHSEKPPITPGTEHRYTFQMHKQNTIEIMVRLPCAGTYVLRVNIMPNNSTEYTSQCNYLINSTNTSVKWPVFPLAYESWAKNFELVEPLDGVLPEKSPVYFKLRVPGVESVLVKAKNDFPLSLSETGYWEGTCNTNDCKYIYVIVCHKAQPHSRDYILQYQVDNRQ